MNNGKGLALYWQILIALLLAILVGSLVTEETTLAGITLVDVFSFIGTLFLNALQMIIVPLIMASIITGVASMGNSGDLGRLGTKTIAYYAASSLIAILIGLMVVNIMTPGLIDGEPAGDRLNLDADQSRVEGAISQTEGRGMGDVVDIFVRMIPTNVIAAAAEGQMLGLIFFSLVFGFFMMKTEGAGRDTLFNFWQGVADTMMRITMWIMRFAPYGVFGLVAETIASTGFAAFRPMLVFFITVVLALALHAFVALPLALKLVGRVRPVKHFRAMSPAMLTAFSSASSSATLPLTMECLQDNAGVSKRTSSFVLPLGATINMDGTALYECVAAIFLAQAYGLDLNFTTQFTIVLIALLTSIGVAGIPAASLVAITVILTAIGMPLEAVGLLLVTDRILDMCRTAVNVFSDSCGAVLIARSEGEDTLLR